MAKFVVERVETVHYRIEYDREQVLDIISEGYDDVRAEYDAMDDETLALNLQVEAERLRRSCYGAVGRR